MTPGAALLVKDYAGATNQTQSITCERFYGGPTPNVVYGGGPVVQVRNLLADGGWGVWQMAPTSRACTRTYTATQTASCPAGLQGALNQMRVTVLSDAGVTTSDSGWLTVSSTCAVYNTGAQSETRPVSCPNGQSGSITETRSYQLWSDGSKRNFDTWAVTSNTCQSVQASIGYNFQALSCPGNQEGLIHQQQAYAIDSNGNAYDFTDWATISSTCRDFESQAFVPELVTLGDCPPGQVGSNTYTRSYTQWTNGARTNYTGWTWVSGNCYTPAPPPPDPGPGDNGGGGGGGGDAWTPPPDPGSTWTPPPDPGPPPPPDPGPPPPEPDPPYNPYPDWCCGYNDGGGGGGGDGGGGACGDGGGCGAF